jgi:amino acid adenylation domain-containing protein
MIEAIELATRLEGLSPQKRELLLRQLRQRKGETARPHLQPRGTSLGDFPLSYVQQRLWFLDQLQPGNPFYNLPGAVRLRGPLEEGCLGRALSEVVRRHETLRTTFPALGGKPVQRVGPAAPFPLPVVDLSGLLEAPRRLATQALTAAVARYAFDLTLGPLLRVVLLRLGPAERILAFAIHHLVSDAWSMRVLIRELTTLYRAFLQGAPSPLPALPVQYADYAIAEREWLGGDALRPQLEYWRGKLAGLPGPLELPADRPRPEAQSFRGTLQAVSVPAGVLTAFKELGQRWKATLFMMLLAGFAALLRRYTSREDLAVGTPITHRDRVEIEGLIGFFVNNLVLRCDLAGDPTFEELVERVREMALEAFAHPDLPFERLVEELHPERSLTHTPIFQVVFAFQNQQGGGAGPAELGVEPLPVEAGRAIVDLTLTLEESRGRAVGALEYATDLFDAVRIQRMAAHLEGLLAAAAADPERPLSSLPLLAEGERQQLILEWNDTAREVPDAPDSLLVHEQLAAQARRRPEASAVFTPGGTLTYGELARSAGRLARTLRALGVGPEVPVGVHLERSPELLIAFIGILQAGGVYVPIDLTQPAERVAILVEDTGMPVLLARAERAAELPPLPARVLPVEAWGELAAGAPPLPALDPENLAYAIYTSGSTGRPKGVEVSHRSLATFVDWHREAYGITETDRVTLAAGVGFDASVWEVWPHLTAGACMVVTSQEIKVDPDRLSAWIAAQEVTLSILPTPITEAVLAAGHPLGAGFHTLLTGGDRLRRHAPPEARFSFFNLYGPTEATIAATAALVPPAPPSAAAVPTIGRPIGDTAVYLLDSGFEPVPVGVLGELCVGGVLVARGYLRRPGLTAERFAPDPFQRGARMYRTGDLARWLPDGNLDFLGRIDHQVKVRGFRIELGEVETALSAHPQVQQAVVAARGDRPESLTLVAWVAADESLTAPELRAFLQARLPAYMVPAVFVLLPELPLTPNGKVDRRALPAPDSAAEESFEAPQTPIEEMLAGLWASVLGVERVGRGDDFFALGGHSLLATQMIARLRQLLDIELPLRALFENPTLAGLAACVEEAHTAAGAALPPILPVSRQGCLPLSFGQQRLWFLDQLEPGSAAYNMPSPVRLAGRLDPAALAASLGELARRHEALRTVFHLAEGEDEPAQRILPAAPVPLPQVDLGGLPPQAREAAVRRLAAREARQPFDLARGPLLRTALLRLADAEHVLLLTLHHIVSDGWSMGVLVRELAVLYAALAAGRPSPLPELPVQYADYAAWQRSWLTGEALAAQLAYWRQALAAAPPLLDLPTDRPRPPVQTFRGARRALGLPAELAAGIRELARSQGVTSFMVLLAALQTLLHRTSGQPVIAVGSPIANRRRAEFEGLIGFFVNTLALAVDLTGSPSFRGLLDRVREVALGAYAHQDLPFEKLVEELAPERNLAHAPLFQVLLSFQGAGGPAAAPPAMGGLAVSPLIADMAATKFDLTLNVEEGDRGFGLALEHNTDLFDPATAGRLLAELRGLLAAALAAPEIPVSELPLLGASQRAQLLIEWNDTAPVSPAWGCLHELIAEQARRAPEAPAVLAPEGTLTRSELAERVGRLAAHLRSLGVGPEVLVGICMERSLDMVVGILGTLAAGGAYVPLDPAYPRERLDFMLADASVPIVLTQERTLARLNISETAPQTAAVAAGGPQWLCIDRDWATILNSPPASPSGVRPDHLAYVIYTSGSTGRPKGVALAHRGAVALLQWASGIYPESDRAGVLASTSICFDLSVFELFLPLCFGGAVVLAENALHLPRLASASSAASPANVTLVNTVPSAIAELVRGEGLPPSVRTIVLAGEPLPRKLVDEIYAVATVERVMNLYGPSEDTTYSTFATIARSGGLPPIGRPVGEGRLYLLAGGFQPVPIGVPGELFLGGAGLARGYLNRPELTAERFVPDPWSGEPGARLYRTGDLARFRADGELLFLGRVDHQVKLRGFRIELGEIEATLRAHPQVAEALVVARGEPASGDLRLIAYVVGREGTPPATPATPATPAVDELRAFLRAKLPPHMVPWAFVSLAAFPLNANGKIDRAALPDPERSAWGAPAELAEPRSEMEHRIAAIWRDQLGRERVGIHDNFFDSGGHSLLAVRVYHRLKRELGRELPLVALFEHPTIAALARYLEGVEGMEGGETTPAPRQRGQERGERRREAATARRRPGRAAATAETDPETQEL